MERLTYRGENGKPYVRADGYYQHCRMNLDIVAERLAAYEDAEEQGLLVRLPCKVGDTVYIHWFEHDNVEVVEKPFSYGMIPYMGETVFLSREEAEAALAKEG